jgi:hypothetical protein
MEAIEDRRSFKNLYIVQKSLFSEPNYPKYIWTSFAFAQEISGAKMGQNDVEQEILHAGLQLVHFDGEELNGLKIDED